MTDTTRIKKRDAAPFVRRANDAVRELRRLMTEGGTIEDWNEECNEALGAISHLQELGSEAYWLSTMESSTTTERVI